MPLFSLRPAAAPSPPPSAFSLRLHPPPSVSALFSFSALCSPSSPLSPPSQILLPPPPSLPPQLTDCSLLQSTCIQTLTPKIKVNRDPPYSFTALEGRKRCRCQTNATIAVGTGMTYHIAIPCCTSYNEQELVNKMHSCIGKRDSVLCQGISAFAALTSDVGGKGLCSSLIFHHVTWGIFTGIQREIAGYLWTQSPIHGYVTLTKMLDQLSLLIVTIEVLTRSKKDGSYYATLNKGTLKDMLFLIG
ncbi:hypothetical protein RIF29_14949 [Crotalaria pallida]|uniref:Uncharacterized protein n=1 Tax=Crotalaria pallida TaxID=3830 RepID=A0AAN9FI38_CROPI